MKIEVGKFYKSRSGNKIRIYALDGAVSGPIHGAFFFDRYWNNTNWYPGGQWAMDREKNPHDIISEWLEQSSRLVAWLYPSSNNHMVIYLPIDKAVSNSEWIRASWLDQPEAK